MVQKAFNKLPEIKYCEAHATYIVDDGDRRVLKNLKINLTCDAEFVSNIEFDV